MLHQKDQQIGLLLTFEKVAHLGSIQKRQFFTIVSIFQRYGLVKLPA